MGSLAWLTRVCRPDLAYSVHYLQSQVSQATYGDIAFANKVIAVARNPKEKGSHYPLKAFDFEQSVIIGLQDASFANDSEANEPGKRSGFRSQSGRLLCLGAPCSRTPSRALCFCLIGTALRSKGYAAAISKLRLCRYCMEWRSASM